MRKKGISLLVLIITVIIIIILAGTVILSLSNNRILDKSRKARFMSDFTNVQDGVNLYSLGKYNAETNEFELPLKGYLTNEDKANIVENNPTLKTKIEELSGSIDTTNLAWISSEDIGAKLSKEKTEKGYVIDVTNGQIYDYVGDVFEGKRWHTLDGGVLIGDTLPPTYEELWDGWIKLTLYYPAGSTEKKWRLGTEGELRADPMLMWQNYLGPITIPLDRVKDVWIKYILNNKEVVIPPTGTLLVDIVPDKTGYTKVPGVKVHINFDETATTKEYRVGDSGWITYNGEFNVTENCIVEARAKKTETIYNTDGTVLAIRNIAGRDLVYIGNIGIEETELPAPIITRLAPVGTEKARVKVTYPAEADKKIYKVNYGIEENYTTEINVENYGTYIIAYYYDASGKRSKSSSIRINDTSSGGAEPSQPYDPNPINPVPKNDIPAPIVSLNPDTLVEEVQVSLSAPANADKLYIKLGRYADYVLYTSPIIVRQNMEIYAYYRTYEGEKSGIGYGLVGNIKQTNKPYVNITANPYPWSWSYGANEVAVTINYSDATVKEYSEDGIIYVPYIAPFVVTENKRIYARGTNSYGVTETSLNITNIGKMEVPTPVENLSVGINVNPEPTVSTTRFTKVNVTIDYDSKATEKYYSIGRYGELKTYNGVFEVTSNCTIYAYAKGVNAQGQNFKKIDNLSNGISQPIITSAPANNEQASKVIVSIEFDKYSKLKRYSIDGTSLRDYAGAFEVTKNGSVIYAYSENELGQKSEASYTVLNIVPEPPILTLDKGQYYILKLNYPETSKNREYKWKVNGEWKSYKEAGILLLKPQYKDQLIQNGTLVKIEDENGNLVTFTGDYYFIDVPISELFENLFMRWDREPLGAPQIVITPTEPAISVTANILYNPNLVTKLYKVVNSDGSVLKDWTNYTGSIAIDRNNTIVYAKGMDDTEVWTAEVMKKVVNIDENQPVIKLTADLDTAQQKVAVKVNVTDDVGVKKVKWAAGVQGESYFTNSGTEIANDSIVNIASNGYYTFYAEDQVGNKQVYTLNVTNVDLTSPVIDIQVIPETTVGLTANVTINYGDSTIKQYKLGTNNATWTNYTVPFAISSYTILANSWQNADGTVTIYAKGKDTAGNEITVQKKVVSLDLDKPNAPIINSNSSYATITLYGVIFDKTTTITYDARTDIDNYYSIDNGATWLLYTGQFDMLSGTVIAKSIKKATGLEVSASKTVAMPPDALGALAYDGNEATYYSMGSLAIRYVFVDSSMGGKTIRVKADTSALTLTVSFLNSSGSIITSYSNISSPGVTKLYDVNYIIPEGTQKIKFSNSANSNNVYVRIYEIESQNEPTFNATNGYMLLNADSTKSIKIPYQMVTINYFPTSVQRLYRIGDTGNWINYSEQAVKVNQGEIIYAKGIDKYGNETRLISNYTVNVTDAIDGFAYDNNESTYYSMGSLAVRYMYVDSSMGGKSIRVKADTSALTLTVSFLNSSGSTLASYSNITSPGATRLYDVNYIVPVGTQKIRFSNSSNNNNVYVRIYEIEAQNEPTFSATNGYMLLHADPTKSIKNPYQMVTINYFPTSVQRLYRIGSTGDWMNYLEQSVKVNNGETLYAKGIDNYGNETRVISSYTANVVDAIGNFAYDNDEATSFSMGSATVKYLFVDSSMGGKSIRVKADTTALTLTVSFLNSSGGTLSSYSNITSPGITKLYDVNYVIPIGTQKIKFSNSTNNNNVYVRIYEIWSLI
ncbi:MAG: coagulation factor 5/8 type protein [Clostridia bacterium]|jgi:hypothetical protein|nr:coagulation factor 5/8 type protein [Clostridia bacterium]